MANDIVNNPNNGVTITSTSTDTGILDKDRTQYTTTYGQSQSIELYTEDEVSRLLGMQRGNCYVAVLNQTQDVKIASVSSAAPEPGQWRKSKNK